MRASGVRPCSFSARSLTTSTADDPSQIWLAFAAEMTPPSFNSLTDPIDCIVASNRMPSSTSWHALALWRLDLQADDLVAKIAPLGRGRGTAVAFQRIGVEIVAAEKPYFLAIISAPMNWLNWMSGVPRLLPRRLRLAQPGLREQHAGRSHRHAGHGFDARRHDHVLRARHDRLRGELDRLL